MCCCYKHIPAFILTYPATRKKINSSELLHNILFFNFLYTRLNCMRFLMELPYGARYLFWIPPPHCTLHTPAAAWSGSRQNRFYWMDYLARTDDGWAFQSHENTQIWGDTDETKQRSVQSSHLNRSYKCTFCVRRAHRTYRWRFVKAGSTLCNIRTPWEFIHRRSSRCDSSTYDSDTITKL